MIDESGTAAGLRARRYLTVEQLAERYHTSAGAVRTLRHRGALPPARRVGRRLLWDLDELEAWEDRECETGDGAA